MLVLLVILFTVTKLITQISQIRIEKAPPQKKRNKNDQNTIVMAIVGDSMIKDVYGWELSDREINDRGHEHLHSASTQT